MQKISPFLWFDGQAEEAASFYVSVFANSRIVGVSRYGETGPGQAGSVMTVTFELNGEAITALNGGPEFSFSPAISLHVTCDTQDEVDYLWEKLSEGGEPGQCGWLTDRYGLSWQIVPNALGELLSDSGSAASQRAMSALLQMRKIDIATLERAYSGEQEAQPKAA
jgi:predicted 3-demethylubiquinone-9 3-methyltransferase (glyoxalase superfamily)